MQGTTWTIKSCLDWTRDYLKDKGDERPRLSAEWLLSSVTGLSRTGLYMSFDKPLEGDELDRMHEMVVRRAKGEPLQYIAGTTTFRTIDVACEPGVLIPRPETELLVEEVLNYLDRMVLGEGAPRTRAELPWNAEVEAARKAEEDAAAQREALRRATAGEHADFGGADDDGDTGDLEPAVEPSDGPDSHALDSSEHADVPADEAEREVPDGADAQDAPAAAVARVLEVGTGTGCISLSLAHERPGRVVCIATDIEPKAVDLAARNRDALGIAPEMVDIRHGNLVSPLDKETEWGTFDVLVSNPPYIPSDVMRELPREVAAFEPALALDGGADGLDIFRRLVNAAPWMLRPGGLLACELFERHLDRAASIAREGGLEDVCIIDDLTGRPRILLACTPAAPHRDGTGKPVCA